MRKVGYILFTLLACLLLTVGITAAFLHSSSMQTAAVRLITDQMSYRLGANARIGRVSFHFPARLQLDSIYIEDQAGDTLAYIRHIYAHMSPLALRQNTLRFPRVELDGVRACAHRLPTGEYNYQFLIDSLSSPADTAASKPFGMSVEINQFSLSNVVTDYDEHHLALQSLSLIAPFFSMDSASTGLEIHNLAWNMSDREPLLLTRLTTAATWADSTLTIPTFHAELPQSKIDLSAQLCGIDSDATFSLNLMGLQLAPADLAPVVPALAGINETLSARAQLSGSLDSVAAYDLRLLYNGEALLTADVYALDLRCPDTAFIRADCRELTIRPHMLQDVISDLTQKPFTLPAPVLRLGTIHYRGLLQGRLPDLYLKGAFLTNLGTITTDGTLHRTPDTRNQTAFTGLVSTSRLQLGRLLDNADLGDLAFSVSGQAHIDSTGFQSAEIKAAINRMSFRGYDYSDLVLDATIADNSLNATCGIDDPNVRAAIQAIMDWENRPEISVSVDLARFSPGPLHLSEQYADLTVSTLLNADLSGTDINELNGYISIDTISLARSELEEKWSLPELTIHVESGESSYHRILLSSELFNGRIEGNYDYNTLPTTCMKFAVQHLPSLFTTKQKKDIAARPSANRLNAYLYGHQWQKLQYVLGLPIRIGDYPVLKANIDEPLGIWELQGYVSDLHTRNQKLTEVTLMADNNAGQAHIDMSANYTGGRYVLHSLAGGDSITLDLSAEGDSSLIVGDIHLATQIAQYAAKPFFSMQIHPSTFVFQDSTYHIDESMLTYSVADTLLTINQFRAGTVSQFVEASGSASPRASDSLIVRLSQVNADFVLPFVLPRQTLIVNGLITGGATLYSLFSRPMFEAKIDLIDAGLNDCHLGDAHARVFLNPERTGIIIDGDVVNPRHRVAHVDGLVDLVGGKGAWGLEIYPDSIPLGFISHWTNGILTDMGGTASGQVNVFGSKEGTWVTARVKANDAHLTIPFTGCTYSFTDSCFMDSTSIRFPNLTVYDREKNPISLNGVLSHQCFQNFNFDIDVNIKKALAFDLPEQPGQFLQGKVYASGNVRVFGDESLVRLDANAKTVGDSWFRFSLGGASSAADNNFITFVDHNVVNIKKAENTYDIPTVYKKKKNKRLPGKFLLGLNIEANPQLLFQLLLSDKSGDMIQARGDGALRLTYDDSQDQFRLMGLYTLLSGSMNFTLANTFRREFTIAEGSTISWQGKPESPELNVTAKYHVTASLKDLFGTEQSTITTTSRTSIPVNTLVSLNGDLDNAAIRFGLEFPMSEEAIRSQVMSVINTEEMMMRQVVYLLIFGRFFTPEFMQTTTMGVNESYSLLSSTVTGQINSWISRLTDAVTLGVNIRSEGIGAASSQEYEAQFQITPISRLIINGNVGYRYNDVSNRPFFGDLDVEYLLTPNGKLRAKAFTHTVDKYSLRQASTIQGVGFVFKHDFNWPAYERKNTLQFTDSTQQQTTSNKRP